MKLFYVIAICTFLGSSCEVNEPIGFWREPQINFTGSRDSFEIHYSNSHGTGNFVIVNDSIIGTNAPIDMNDNFMSYEVVSNDTSFGVIEVRYAISPKDDSSKYALNLIFDTSDITSDDRLRLFRNNRMTDTVERLHNYDGGLNSIYISF